MKKYYKHGSHLSTGFSPTGMSVTIQRQLLHTISKSQPRQYQKHVPFARLLHSSHSRTQSRYFLRENNLAAFLRKHKDERKPNTTISDEEIVNKEREAFQKLKPQLLRNPKMYGKFVAISSGKVMDYDADKITLIKRVFTKIGYVPIYVDKVSKAERVVELPSPERV